MMDSVTFVIPSEGRVAAEVEGPAFPHHTLPPTSATRPRLLTRSSLHKGPEQSTSGLRAVLLLTAMLLISPNVEAQRPSSAQIDALFTVTGDAPGCAVGVRHNGVVVHRNGYGLADIEHRVPIMPTSVFYTGSISKQFTATSVALAAHDGAFGLDDQVRRWIPELPEVARDITVRQLIHHTGGLREKWDLLSMQGVPTATTLITQQMVLDLVSRQRDVNFTAGTRYAYNNTGYDLLATLIERATGKPIRRFAAERIFSPLGMRSALYADSYGELIPQRVTGYEQQRDAWTLAPAMVETVGSGSVYASLDDLLAWAASWENGVLGDTALQRQLETPGALSDGTPLTYAWGLQVDQWQGMRRVRHAGSLAGYRTTIWRLPDQKWAGVILCNSAQANPDAKMATLAWLYFAPDDRLPVDDLVNVRTVAPGIPAGAMIPDDLPGEYWSEELQVTWTIARRDSSYVLRRGMMPELMLQLNSAGEVLAGGWGIAVVRDEAGKIAELVVGAGRSSGVRFGRR